MPWLICVGQSKVDVASIFALLHQTIEQFQLLEIRYINQSNELLSLKARIASTAVQAEVTQGDLKLTTLQSDQNKGNNNEKGQGEQHNSELQHNSGAECVPHLVAEVKKYLEEQKSEHSDGSEEYVGQKNNSDIDGGGLHSAFQLLGALRKRTLGAVTLAQAHLALAHEDCSAATSFNITPAATPATPPGTTSQEVAGGPGATTALASNAKETTAAAAAAAPAPAAAAAAASHSIAPFQPIHPDGGGGSSSTGSHSSGSGAQATILELKSRVEALQRERDELCDKLQEVLPLFC
jgi:hypothetical protein